MLNSGEGRPPKVKDVDGVERAKVVREARIEQLKEERKALEKERDAIEEELKARKRKRDADKKLDAEIRKDKRDKRQGKARKALPQIRLAGGDDASR